MARVRVKSYRRRGKLVRSSSRRQVRRTRRIKPGRFRTRGRYSAASVRG